VYQQSPIIERLWREEAANLGQSGPVIDLGIRSDQLYVAVKLEMEFLRPDASPLIVQGTGFVVVDIRRSLAVVVTSRHLLDPAFRPPGTNRKAQLGLRLHEVRGKAWRRSGTGLERFVWRIESPRAMYHLDDHLDVGLLDLNDLKVESGSNTLEFYVPRDLLSPRSDFDGSIISAADMVAVIGYPEINGDATDSPLLIPGILSSDPRISAPLPGLPTDIVAYHAFSRSGMSGAPVVAPTRGLKVTGDISIESADWRGVRIVGVNSGHLRRDSNDPMPLSYFCPSWAVLEILDQVAFGQ